MQTTDRISATLEQMPISTLMDTDARALDQTSVDPISGEPMVDVTDDGDHLTVARGWQIIVDAKRDGKSTVPARITRVDRFTPPVPRMIRLSSIIPDPRLQPRVALHEHVIAEYAERMREGAEFPPIDVVRTADGFYWLAAGWHRYYARERAGFDEIASIIHEGTLEDAVLIAAPSNGTHGKPMNNADKNRAVRMILDHPRATSEAWSDQRIADAAGVARSMVHKVRSEMERTGRRAVQDVRQGGDGKLYPIRSGPPHPTDAEPAANGRRRDESAVEPPTDDREPPEPLAPVDIYGCAEDGCGLVFAVPSWHCRDCGRHWPVAFYTACPNCTEPDDPQSSLAVASEPVVSVVDVPMPQPERPSEPQARYEPATLKPDAVVGAYGMTSAAIDMISTYMHHAPADVAAVPTDDVKRERLNYLSAMIDWLVSIEQRWKADLGVETAPAVEVES